MAISPVSMGLAAAILGLAGGCAAQSDALRRDVTDLKHEVASLRAANLALRERVDALEAPAPDGAGKTSDAAPAPTAEPRPELKVVRLRPDEQPSDGWTFIDPSDPKHEKLPVAPAPAGMRPATIRNLPNGAVVADALRAAPARKVAP